MATIKKFGDSYYFCTISSRRIGRKKKRRIYRKQFLVKYGSISQGCGYMVCRVGNITCPKELIGKRVRLKLEVVE